MGEVDTQGYYEKYKIERLDGKPLGRTFTIEIDKDPQASAALCALAHVYAGTRPVLAEALLDMAAEVESQGGKED